MSTTIDDINHDIYLEEKWEDERKSVFEALKIIANSRNIDELVKNLEKLKGIYISDKCIGNENLNKLIEDINFEMPKLKKYISEEFEKNTKSCKVNNRKYFIYGAMVTGILGFIF